MNTAPKLHEQALKVVHSAVGEITEQAPVSADVKINEVEFTDKTCKWIRIEMFRDTQHEEYVYTREYFTFTVEDYMATQYDFEDIGFYEWWIDLSWIDMQVACLLFLDHIQAGKNIDEDYAIWLAGDK